jgi:hypothetical protein
MAEIARVKTITTGFSGAPGVTTQYFRKRTSLGWSNYVTDLTERPHGLFTDLGSMLCSQMTFTTLGTVEVLDDATGELQGTYIGQEPVGTGPGSGSYGPIASGLLIRWGTNDVANGRHVRGRTFIVPLATNMGNAAGVIDVSHRQTAQNAAETYIGSGGEAVVPVIWHRPVYTGPSGSRVLSRAGASFDVKNASVMTGFTVLRSRRD